MSVRHRATCSIPCLALATTLVCLMVSPMAAQTAGQPAAFAAHATDNSGFERIVLTAGRSTVLKMPFDVTRLAVTNPAIADAVVVQPREVLIDGRSAGTVSLIVWCGDERHQYDVVVDPGVTPLQQTLQNLFPGENIRVSMNDESIILTGNVSGNEIMLRAGEVAAGTSSKARVINLLQLPGGSASQQVMLQVRIAEVNRRALQELGVNLFSNRANATFRSTTEQFAAPAFDDQSKSGLVFSDFLNLFFFSRQAGLGAVIKALQQKGFFQSLAEPNLIAYNNQEASFLAGGEFPVPIVQGVTGAVTVQFKEFGVRLTFKPTIAGDVIRLKVRPEVSSLDFNNGITLQGFRIPSLITRRAETDVELRDGQSFAIAGLMNNMTQNDGANVPFLSKIPIVGYLFKSNADRKERTELMVLVTPHLVRPLDPDELPALPTKPERFLPSGSDSDGRLEGGGGPVDAAPANSRAKGTR